MTFIDGIAASQNIDSSGERISIQGMDISSLAVDGVFTFEHEAATGPRGEKLQIKMPQQTVGKILEAKKIFGPEDCENDRHTHFWEKCQTPFIYVMGELLDDYTDAAKDLAGKFKYDADHAGQNQRSMMNFSIEGGYIQVDGMEVTRSVARKCTITITPCNKAAGAEMVPAQGTSKGATNFESLFKTEMVEIELFKTEPRNFTAPVVNDMQKHAEILGIDPMSKIIPIKKALTSVPGQPAKSAPTNSVGPSAPRLPGATNNSGTHLGNTKSGKAIQSHAKIHEYHGFSGQDHQDAANMHHVAAQGATDPKMGAHHLGKMKLHLQAGKTAEQREGRFARGAKLASTKSQAMHANPSLFEKSMEAGSGMAAPGNLVQGAALAKEDLNKKLVKRAEEEYSSWPMREQFQVFMASRLPHLTKGEIDAIGQTLALKKTVDAEKALSKLFKYEAAPKHAVDGETNIFSKLPKDHSGPIHTVSWSHPKTGSSNKYHFPSMDAASSHAKALGANGIKDVKIFSS